MVRNRNAAFRRSSGTRAARDSARAPGAGVLAPLERPRGRSHNAPKCREGGRTPSLGVPRSSVAPLSPAIAEMRGRQGMAARPVLTLGLGLSTDMRIGSKRAGSQPPGVLDAVGTPVTGEGERGRIPRVVRRVLHATRRQQVRAEVRGGQRATQPQFRTRLRCAVTFFHDLSHLSHSLLWFFLMAISYWICRSCMWLDHHHLHCTKLSL
ncbi:hypothetical protein EDB86DRAFT_1289077 [Lactarius hatsudake]|nr:hypothetical protein EDB86DRAFT_1289077 [Lactarius hatsudake]